MRLPALISNKLGLAVHHHLRRVDGVGAEGSRIDILALGKLPTRVGILPAKVIPIVDVLFERYYLSAFDWLLFAHLLQELVRRWAARTAFGGKQFHDHRRTRAAVGFGLGRSAATSTTRHNHHRRHEEE